ncbi:MAG TPA: FapA family protein [Accumulibacter sp.]|uniref:flagellar assembly protein A n=1 Tax=Accumulibacter sp. TaxID=2053492 RepID=UPI0025D97CED|nr:flagellar assembly protein A [Accumulibacter sp.]MCM8597041.1 FapA family protein [Accumulibacter sp.]MCM8663678.1 FapA family protein [Accumulibacter sp.]HNC51077.1 FapA family protein [Accumulibacter sp.]
MPQYPKSAIGNLADLEEGQIALSGFIVQHDKGLYVRIPQIGSENDFPEFVNRVAASGLYFRELDYLQFSSLLYDEPASRSPGAGDEVFLAADITAFRPERQALYQDFSIDNGEASYLFEPLYGTEGGDDQAWIKDGEDGHQASPGRARRPLEIRIYLDIDEFIINAWNKGVRFGIDLAALGEAIEVDRPERRVVARRRPYLPGKDAEIIEQAPGLHRNNAPRQLVGGRFDLRQFETRYPQVTAGLRLVRKTPRTLGVDGRDLSGEILPAPLPKDFDLETLAGPGTRVSREQGGDYLLSSVYGFLNIDRRSNQFSVVDKIVSHEGVSARTTGDLTLTGDVYEQHGEIQEHRIVQCRSITAYADVFGKIVSGGGVVHLRHNLVGGSASNEDGDIVVDGRASASTLVAQQGCITVKRADNCVIVGRRVVVGQATNCDIVADELSLDLSEACALAGRSIRVRVSRSRWEVESVLLLLLPDLSGHALQLAALEKKRVALRKALADQRARMGALQGEKDVASYLSLGGKLRRHEVTLSPEQQLGWRRLSALVAPALRTLSQLTDTIREHDEQLAALDAQVEELLAARRRCCSGLSCTIDRVEGETRVDTLSLRLSDTPLGDLPSKELRIRLRRTDAARRRLFSGASGQFSWTYDNQSAAS